MASTAVATVVASPHLTTEFIVKPLVVLVSFAYPFYASFKALDSQSSDNKAQWLTYWTVLACINFVESIFFWVLVWLPIFFSLKLLFVLWLQLPMTKGASIIYWKFLYPQIKKHEDKIDSAVSAGQKRVMRMKDQWASIPVTSSSATVSSRPSAAERVLQEMEAGDAGEKGE
ncbi:unnamed protein product [Closterium sp. NIES-64]|nr:unnamed protein product [Closterium sp. NIES-65]CAI5950866.1 unnamed protein product [Closterium sp. NIES-64]CAI5951628.1 unnamed protein product [Closterium sp. NIES-64]CAI5953140.1 unnamed protein product [Closterium sp. NIES-65]